MKNYFLAYSYLNVKGPPLSDYYDYINFITVNNLNCLIFSVLHFVIIMQSACLHLLTIT